MAESHCYKVVTSVGLFARLYDIQDIGNIPEGTEFTANFFPDRLTIPLEPPVLLFSDCASDAMFWYHILNNIRWDLFPPEKWQDTCIYEIEPKTRITKNRCCDEYGLFESGARVIKFGKKVPIDQMYQDALQEYNREKFSILLKYGIYNWPFIMKNVDLWRTKCQ